MNGTRVAELESPAGGWGALARLARPHQWTKNLLLLAALVFSRHLFIFRDDVIALAGVVAFCALASFAYTLNDIMDRESDRLNPEKRDRPLARGDLNVGTAVRFALVLVSLGLAISLAIGWAFLAIAFLYLALQFGYSMWAKRIVVLDVIAVAAGFVMRAYAGGVAIHVKVSPWLVFITFSLALFLGLARRRHELTILGGGAEAHRGVLGEYNIRLIDQMLAIVAGTTLVGYMTYTASIEIEAKLGSHYHQLAVLTVPFVAFGILRYLYLVDEHNEGGDPTRVLLEDKQLRICMALWILPRSPCSTFSSAISGPAPGRRDQQLGTTPVEFPCCSSRQIPANPIRTHACVRYILPPIAGHAQTLYGFTESLGKGAAVAFDRSGGDFEIDGDRLFLQALLVFLVSLGFLMLMAPTASFKGGGTGVCESGAVRDVLAGHVILPHYGYYRRRDRWQDDSNPAAFLVGVSTKREGAGMD